MNPFGSFGRIDKNYKYIQIGFILMEPAAGWSTCEGGVWESLETFKEQDSTVVVAFLIWIGSRVCR